MLLRCDQSSDDGTLAWLSALVGVSSHVHWVDWAQRVSADLLDVDHRQALLVPVDGLNSSTNSSTLESSSNHLLALDTEDVEAMADPVLSDVGQDNDETDKWNNEGDASVRGVGNSTLDRWEDSSARDTHDENTCTASSVLAEVGSTESEDCWIPV